MPFHSACGTSRVDVTLSRSRWTSRVDVILSESLLDGHSYERLKKKNTHTHTANGYLEIVKEWVLERSVDMNGRDKKGWTGLHRASSKGHVKIVEFLIRNGADVNRTNKYNMIALYIAILSDRLESAKIMIENGSNVNIRIGSNSPDSFQRGKSPLDLACYKGQLEICSLLLENGANPNDGTESTPLILACQAAHFDVAALLLKHGVDDVNKYDHTKTTALQYACAASSSLEIVRLVFERQECHWYHSNNKRSKYRY